MKNEAQKLIDTMLDAINKANAYQMSLSDQPALATRFNTIRHELMNVNFQIRSWIDSNEETGR